MHYTHKILALISLLLFLSSTNGYLSNDRKPKKPNIIIILADDLGFNDVSFHGSNQIFTPNIDSLGYDGIILNQYYVPALCTPSRGALLTGRYPIHTGLQHFVIPSDEPWGLPLEETTLAEILAGAGYTTQMVGKWHLGFHKKAFTPTYRGFQRHFGYLGPYIDYYDHSLFMLDRNYSRGYDMRLNLSVHYETKGTYATDLFNEESVRVILEHDASKPLFLYIPHLAPHTANEDDPMQAPEEEINKYRHIADKKRRTYAAMVSKFDEGVGKVMKALSEKNMLENSIVIVYADNGGPTLGLHSNTGSNYPLRGQKNSPWEGGIRSSAVMWSPLLRRTRRVSQQLMYATDWLPTLAAAAGIKLSSDLALDGYNMWEALSRDLPSPRRNILHNIDDIIGYSSYMRGSLKYVDGTTVNGMFDGWLGDIPDESDPRTLRYSHSILRSQVSQVLSRYNAINHRRQLNLYDIEYLRLRARVVCLKVPYTQENKEFECNSTRSPCLFDILQDPCEQYNLASWYPSIVDLMAKEVEGYRSSARAPANVPRDPACDPALHNYTWTWWQEDTPYSIRYSQQDRLYLPPIIKS